MLTQAHVNTLKAGIDPSKWDWQAILAFIEAFLAALKTTPKPVLKAACAPGCTDECCDLMCDAIQHNFQAVQDCMNCCNMPTPTP